MQGQGIVLSSMSKSWDKVWAVIGCYIHRQAESEGGPQQAEPKHLPAHAGSGLGTGLIMKLLEFLC